MLTTMKKKLATLSALMFPAAAALACPLCEKQQPRFLQGITHGTGPSSNWDYIIICTMAIIVAFTLYFSVKMLLKPGEHKNNHIKRTVLTFEDGTEK